MIKNLELLSLLLPDEVKGKLALLDESLTPEEQFNGFMELIQDETGLELKFNKNKSLRENLKPILDKMPITERVGCNKLLNVVEEKLKNSDNENKDIMEAEKIEETTSKSIESSTNPDLLYFK